MNPYREGLDRPDRDRDRDRDRDLFRDRRNDRFSDSRSLHPIYRGNQPPPDRENRERNDRPLPPRRQDDFNRPTPSSASTGTSTASRGAVSSPKDQTITDKASSPSTRQPAGAAPTPQGQDKSKESRKDISQMLDLLCERMGAYTEYQAARAREKKCNQSLEIAARSEFTSEVKVIRQTMDQCKETKSKSQSKMVDLDSKFPSHLTVVVDRLPKPPPVPAAPSTAVSASQLDSRLDALQKSLEASLLKKMEDKLAALTAAHTADKLTWTHRLEEEESKTKALEEKLREVLDRQDKASKSNSKLATDVSRLRTDIDVPELIELRRTVEMQGKHISKLESRLEKAEGGLKPLAQQLQFQKTNLEVQERHITELKSQHDSEHSLNQQRTQSQMVKTDELRMRQNDFQQQCLGRLSTLETNVDSLATRELVPAKRDYSAESTSSNDELVHKVKFMHELFKENTGDIRNLQKQMDELCKNPTGDTGNLRKLVDELAATHEKRADELASSLQKRVDELASGLEQMKRDMRSLTPAASNDGALSLRLSPQVNGGGGSHSSSELSPAVVRFIEIKIEEVKESQKAKFHEVTQRLGRHLDEAYVTKVQQHHTSIEAIQVDISALKRTSSTQQTSIDAIQVEISALKAAPSTQELAGVKRDIERHENMFYTQSSNLTLVQQQMRNKASLDDAHLDDFTMQLADLKAWQDNFRSTDMVRIMSAHIANTMPNGVNQMIRSLGDRVAKVEYVLSASADADANKRRKIANGTAFAVNGAYEQAAHG